MNRLSHSDWAGISSALPSIYSQRNFIDLACAWMNAAKCLLSADLLISGELDTSTLAVNLPLLQPYNNDVVKLAPAFLELSGKVPELMTGYSKKIRFGPVTSRISQRNFERTEVYNAFHRPLGLRHQFAGFVPGLPPPHIGFVVHRRSRDFSTRDDQILRHLCEHYAAAAKNVRDFTRLLRQNASLTQANEIAGQGIVFLKSDWTLRAMTPFAAKQFTKYFGDWRNCASLPKPVLRWMREQSHTIAEERAVEMPIEPLKVRCSTQQLTVRLLLDATEPPMLVASEQGQTMSIDLLKRFGLTPRETEVLYWLAQGKTNAEIAASIGTREGTARKHVEHILTHFGTQNRTATVLHVFEQLRSEAA